MVISRSKITSKRQITLPVKVMERLRLHPGDDIVFEEHEGRIEIKNTPQNYTIKDFIQDQKRRLKGMTIPKFSDEQIRQAAAEGWTERYLRYLKNNENSV